MKKNVPLLIPLLILLVATGLSAQSTDLTKNTKPSVAKFSLDDDERVLFVGNSLFENDLPYGYLELALTTRWPDRNVTFRNIGWAGDNVFGEARSYITNPPTPNELLLKQITDARPTLVFVAYGGIEAYAGEAGIPDFTRGLHALIDTISRLGAKMVLLSPIPAFPTSAAKPSTDRNEMLAKYTATISQIAAGRGTLFIDIFNPLKELGETVTLSDNGFHLNEAGYYQLAALLDEQPGASPRSKPVTLDVSKKGIATSETAKILKTTLDGVVLQYKTESEILPLPLPQTSPSHPTPARLHKITGLKKGFYALTADGLEVASASSDQWAEGVGIRQGPDFAEAKRLKDMIVEKNELFFHQYRPHNRTYILGFRAYEQGRHAEGLQELSLIITWLEGQIALHRAPVSALYQLRKID